ncbi:hypothetical protein BYT27DRAFT_7214061 [Phlegmacium glaucopus]|nr:hypothetical protein BYT27DRAFT_7214061 [Phlegmacium glaucopus]
MLWLGGMRWQYIKTSVQAFSFFKAYNSKTCKNKVLEHSNSLKRRIDAWISIQHLYMPAVALLRAKDDSAALSPVAVHDIKLFMPSSCPETLRCAKNLLICEWQFRYSQAEEILNALRETTNPKPTTTFQCQQQNFNCDKELQVLSVPLLETTWRNIFHPLAETDVVGLTSMDDSGSEGRKRLSWIWKVHGTGADADECTQAALRVEWCKARARAHRWQEECLLLNEEMSNWWRSLAAATTERPNVLQSGKIAYADRQADIRDAMRIRCEAEWKGLSAKLLTMDGRDPSIMVECH